MLKLETYILSVFLILAPTSLRHTMDKNIFVLWNVGQGHWGTFKNTHGHCHHFVGKFEKIPLVEIRRLCPYSNTFYSLNGTTGSSRFFSFFQNPNIEKPSSLKKLKIQNSHFEKSHIEKDSGPEIAMWSHFPDLNPKKRYSHSNKSSNYSKIEKIYVIQGQILITGNSTQKTEKFFLLSKHHSLENIKIWILGKNGSIRSNSQDLLSAMPKLQYAWVSQRWASKFHPHGTILGRFRKNKTPILLTEKWGNIWISL